MEGMIFAAGLGTRLRPLTDDRPKAMVKLAGKPLLEHVILKMRKAGIDRIVVNVHHFAEQIESFLNDRPDQGKAPVSGGHKERLLLWDMVQGKEAGKFLGAGRAKGVQLDCLGAIMGQRVQKFRQGVFHHKTLRILGTGNIQFLAGEKDSFQRHCLIPRFLPFNL